jgi:murein DD-endopeptidase MepM/ murein hydrolase activator NlpD
MPTIRYIAYLTCTSQQSLRIAMLTWLLCCAPAVFAQSSSIIKKTPTIVNNTLLRGDVGVFGAPRANGKSHVGVDIVANQLSSDKSIYLVRAVRDGIVAYAKFNGENAEEGYGYTVVLDQGRVS